MKSFLFGLFALVLMTLSAESFADWSRRPPPPPGWGGGRPGWGTCTVLFQKCDFNINGFCVKWNNKSLQIPRRDYYYGCQIAEQQWGYIRNCRISCP